MSGTGVQISLVSACGVQLVDPPDTADQTSLVSACGVQVSAVSLSGSHFSRPLAAIIHEISADALLVLIRIPAPVIVTAQGIEAWPR